MQAPARNCFSKQNKFTLNNTQYPLEIKKVMAEQLKELDKQKIKKLVIYT
ncbi:MAG: hypothetical protein WCI04_03045 [archaeon]